MDSSKTLGFMNGSVSKYAPNYKDANATLVTSFNSDNSQVAIHLYKICDGPNLVYFSSEVTTYTSRQAPALAMQIQFESPECAK